MVVIEEEDGEEEGVTVKIEYYSELRWQKRVMPCRRKKDLERAVVVVFQQRRYQ